MNKKIKFEITLKTLALVLWFISYLILLANSLIFKYSLVECLNDHYIGDAESREYFYNLYQYLNITFYIILATSIIILIITIIDIIKRIKGKSE